MAEFTIFIAGQSIAVTSLFDSSRDYCRKYWTEEAPSHFVRVFPEELAQEQELARQEAMEEGFRFRQFSDPFLDRAVIQRKVAEALFPLDILLFHGSALAVDGEGYLFTAKSGTGKSTHTRYWQETFGQRVVMVNDDKPFLRFESDTIFLCGSPWSGKHGLDSNITVPLKGICILRRGGENIISPLPPEEALPSFLHQACPPLDATCQPKCQALVKDLAHRVPLWDMACTKSPEAAMIAYRAMHG